MRTGRLGLRGEQSFIFEAVSNAGGKAPTDRRQAGRHYARTGSGGTAQGSAGTGAASTARRRARGSGTRLPGLRDRSHGCCQPDPGTARRQHRRHLQPAPPPTRSGGHRPSGPSRPSAAATPPPGLAPLPPRLTGRAGRRSSPRAAGTGGCWPSLRGSARSSSSSSSRRRQARPPRARAALLLPRRPPAGSSPRTALTPASPWRTPRPRRPPAAPAPRPAPPARLRSRRHRPPRGAPGKRVLPAYNAENAPRATRSKLHLPACPAARPARSRMGSIRGSGWELESEGGGATCRPRRTTRGMPPLPGPCSPGCAESRGLPFVSSQPRVP